MKKNSLLLIALSIFIISFSGHLYSTYKSQTTIAELHIQIKNPLEKESITGVLEIELYDQKAPLTVKNFIQYSKDGFYNNTIFHRIINNFMVQGGGYTADLSLKTPKAPIKNEATNGLQNTYGTIAMARTTAPHSATSQFFINISNNSHLNHRNQTNAGYGYAVFGKITESKENQKLLTLMRGVMTKKVAQHQNVPVNPIIIEKVSIKKTKVLL